MSKQEFLDKLRRALSGLPREDIEERLTFYSEMIDDRMEEGLTEEEAVAEIGPVDEVVAQITAEIPLSRLVKERVRPKRALRAWEIFLLVLGSPVWLPLLLAGIAVIFAMYVAVWAVIISLWAVEVSLAGSALGGVVAAVVVCLQGRGITGISLLGAGIFCAGLTIFWFFGCREITKGILLLTKKAALGIKTLFIGKEETRNA